jgi:hypothetical protein
MIFNSRRPPVALKEKPERPARPRVNRGERTVEHVPHHLQVVAELARADLPAFHRSSHRLVGLIESAGLKLELSCWEVRGDVVNFYNYWSMEADANRLTFAELVLPDLPGFARFAKLWLSETKDLVVPINDVKRTVVKNENLQLDEGKQYVYVRAVQTVPFVGISEFAARLEAGLIPFAKDNGWFLGDAYWGLTGPSGRVVQMWIVPEEDALFAAQRLATASWQTLVAGVPSYQVLEPTPADPLLGSLYWGSRQPLARRAAVRIASTQ